MPDVSTLQVRLDLYLSAERAILSGAQSYQLAGRTVTRANLPAIQAEIQRLEMRITFASGRCHGHATFGG